MPSTVRVSDLAKEVGLEPGELLRVLQADFGVRARTVSSSIPDGDARKVRNRLRLQQRRASRPDRRLQAEENIRRAAEQRLLREAAEAKARGEEAERRAREEAEKKAQEEAEAKVQAAEAEAQRQELERAAVERKAEEERQAAEAAARRAAEDREPEAARKLKEQAQEKRTVRPPVPETPDGTRPDGKRPDGKRPDGKRDDRGGGGRDPEPSARPERLAAASREARRTFPGQASAPAPDRDAQHRFLCSAQPIPTWSHGPQDRSHCDPTCPSGHASTNPGLPRRQCVERPQPRPSCNARVWAADRRGDGVRGRRRPPRFSMDSTASCLPGYGRR